VVARLRDGVREESAREELAVIGKRLSDTYADSNATVTVGMAGLADDMTAGARKNLVIVLVAVGVVLLIACVNVAGLTIARGSARGRELSVRAAIGASRGRLVRQLATEGLVLFVIGGALGLTLAAWGVAALASELPATLPRAAEISVDWRFVAFGAALTLTSGLLFSVLPALSIARRGPASGLAGARGTVSAGRAVQRTRGILIAAQIAAAVVLLAGAALALRSFDRVRQADKGFETDRTMTFGFVMRDRSFPQAAHMKDFAGRVRGGASGRAGCRSRRAHDPSAAGRQQSRKHLYRRRFARRGGTGSADCGRARRERPLSHGHRRAAAAGARPVAD
jgi:putative ABC transport system permease protein